MKRAENCVNCKVNHIYFKNDSLVFSFAKSKGHQKGEKHVGPWHVYVSITRNAAKGQETRKMIDDYHKELTEYDNQHNDKIVKLTRHGSGMFQPTPCGLCGVNTQHRCTYGVSFSKFLDVSTNERICGELLCGLCRGEISSKNRCAYHLQRDEYGDSE